MPQDKTRQVLIITYLRAINFGSSLQAFALNLFLRKNGFNVRTFDYTTESQQKLYQIFEAQNNALSLCRNIQSLIYYKKLRVHKDKFEQFISCNIPTTERARDGASLQLLSKEADFVICGSDQIWNADCEDFDTNYMLSFISDKDKCIAYAPSLGAGGRSSSTMEALAKFTKQFKALSSRERSGSEIISSITKRCVTTVADPVFLLSTSDWEAISSERIFKGEYILGYFIGDVPGMREYTNTISRMAGIPVVVILKNLRDMKYGFKKMYEAGPADFVTLVRNAKLIVTNSFHAVAFSIIFRKDFRVFTKSESGDNRISDLLDLTELTDRIVDADNLEVEEALQPVSYTCEGLSRLNNLINQSKQYLLNNLT